MANDHGVDANLLNIHDALNEINAIDLKLEPNLSIKDVMHIQTKKQEQLIFDSIKQKLYKLISNIIPTL